MTGRKKALMLKNKELFGNCFVTQYPHQLLQALAIFVVASFLFVCFKLFVFRDASNSETKEST
jgi:hypothetical protein